MKRSFRGLTYDTEKATQVHKAWGSYEEGYAEHEEALHITEKGRLFVSCETTGEIYIFDTDKDRAESWLDACRAPESAYEAIGIELEDA